MTSNKLCLYFCHDNQDRIEQCIAALRIIANGEIEFESHRGSVDMRDVLTKPEYMHVKCTIVLTFKSTEEVRRFMSIPGARGIYDRYARTEDPSEEPCSV